MELTLLDPKDGATSFCVRLPPELELPKRAQDYVIGVTGRLDINCCGPTIEVFLQGTSFDYSTARCRNRIGREACLEKLMTEIEPMKIRTLAMPLRQIGLVTGANTRAEYDVCDRLNRGRFGIGVKTFDVALVTRHPPDQPVPLDCALQASRRASTSLPMTRASTPSLSLAAAEHRTISITSISRWFSKPSLRRFAGSSF